MRPDPSLPEGPQWVSLDDGTVWPVGQGRPDDQYGVSWSLRHDRSTVSVPECQWAASVLSAYASLTDPTQSLKDAMAKLRRARRAQAQHLEARRAH